ncbi:NADPH oxidase regulator NoxR, partial [Conidiobolus coronatus NRRL 28638]
MAYKAGLEQWSLAVKAYEEQNYEEALNIFTDMGGGSKIQYNIGNIYSLLGDNDLAIASFTASIQLDNYFAIGYFARGISNFEIGDLESAFEDFNNALLYLRGNLFIDYFQLGMDFKLYSCEVLYNRAICYFKMNQPAEAMNDLLAAFNDKNEDKHALIAHALEVAGKGCDLFAVPTGTIFRPCESMVRNTKKIDYLGQAKLIAANN